MILTGYIPERTRILSDNEIVCKYINDKSEKITLTIFEKELIFEQDGKDRKEITKIIEGPDDKNNPMINKFICEKRERGIIITETREYYDWTKFTDKEDAFWGEPLEPTKEYQKTTKRILKSVIGYEGEIKYDRDSLLNCICYESSEIEPNEEKPKKKTKLLDKLLKK